MGDESGGTTAIMLGQLSQVLGGLGEVKAQVSGLAMAVEGANNLTAQRFANVERAIERHDVDLHALKTWQQTVDNRVLQTTAYSDGQNAARAQITKRDKSILAGIWLVSSALAGMIAPYVNALIHTWI